VTVMRTRLRRPSGCWYSGLGVAAMVTGGAAAARPPHRLTAAVTEATQPRKLRRSDGTPSIPRLTGTPLTPGVPALGSPAEAPLTATLFARSLHEASRNGPRRRGHGRVFQAGAEGRGSGPDDAGHVAHDDDVRHVENAGRHREAHDGARHIQEDGARDGSREEAGRQEARRQAAVVALALGSDDARD